MNMVKIGSKDYVLKYDFRALSELQEYGISFTVEAEYKLKDIAKLLELGLRKFQKEVTFDGCFELIDTWLEDSSLSEIMGTMAKALETALGNKKPTAPQA